MNFRKQETNIPLTCIFIYKVQAKLVQCTLQITWGKKKTKEKKCVTYFVHVYTLKKTY